jgi:hypothetical protein
MHYVIGDLWNRPGLKRPLVMKDGNKIYQIKIERKKHVVRSSSETRSTGSHHSHWPASLQL